MVGPPAPRSGRSLPPRSRIDPSTQATKGCRFVGAVEIQAASTPRISLSKWRMTSIELRLQNLKELVKRIDRWARLNDDKVANLQQQTQKLCPDLGLRVDSRAKTTGTIPHGRAPRRAAARPISGRGAGPRSPLHR